VIRHWPRLDAIELLEQTGMARLEYGGRLPRVLLELFDGLLLAASEFVEDSLTGLRQFRLDEIVPRLILGGRPRERFVEFVLGGVQFRFEPLGNLVLARSEFLFGRVVAGLKFRSHSLFGGLTLRREPIEIGQERTLNR
jgi:hypothetical protein